MLSRSQRFIPEGQRSSIIFIHQPGERRIDLCNRVQIALIDEIITRNIPNMLEIIGDPLTPRL
jgi:hypothetical protein